MRIAYLTTDEVNLAWAAQFAEALQATLEPRAPVHGPPEGPFDAMIYDLDYLPAEIRETALADMLSGRFSCPTAVHSHNLDEHHILHLRRNGVVVRRHIGTTLFRALMRTVRLWPEKGSPRRCQRRQVRST